MRGFWKEFFKHSAVLTVTIFLQFVYINILPKQLTSADLFLLIACFYVLKADYKVGFTYVFVSVLFDEIIFPASKIIGVKTLPAIVLGYVFYLIFRKMVLKGYLVCLTAASYSVLTIAFSKLLAIFVGAGGKTGSLYDYISLFVITFVLSCLAEKKLNVWRE